MGLLDRFRNKPAKQPTPPPYLYTEQELDEYEAYIQTSLGHYDKVFHELVSSDIHLDVIIIPPTPEHPFYKLVTMGAGAYPMKVPEEYRQLHLEHGEYVIFLPKDWEIGSADEAHYWPIRNLKNVGRLALHTDSWLAYGHTIQANGDGTPFADNTGFNCTMLVSALSLEGENMSLQLSSGKKINFYQLIPLYPEEYRYRRENGADALVDLLVEQEDFPVVQIARDSVVE